MSAANRRRGADAERAVVAYLRENGWPDARRYLAGDGRQPGDIDAIPGVCIEVKDRAASAWPTWREQVLAEAGKARVAVVVRRTRGVTDVGEWTCQVPFWTLWRLSRKACVKPFDCNRTGQPWVALPFGQVIDLVGRLS